jgi:hypothetical protein
LVRKRSGVLLADEAAARAGVQASRDYLIEQAAARKAAAPA